MEEHSKERINSTAMESISLRLSYKDSLYFPRNMQEFSVDPSRRKTILLDLLVRDTAVFLERYGAELTFDELMEFERLKDDYEINWHINHLRSLKSPTKEDMHSRSITVKNRRFAYMYRLLCEGQYFSEDSMREREPYLHHEYVGKFQDPTGRSMARPGERWSETLLRRAEEAVLVEKIRAEQQRLGITESYWISNAEEEDDDDDDDDDDDEEEESQVSHISKRFGEQATAEPEAARCVEPFILSAAEMQDQMDQFTLIMQQKFLSGEDYDHMDYSKIDEDVTLDDHWLGEKNRDAEEKYFAED